MNLHSVRVRLMLWNVAVLALVLAGFGIALSYTVQESLRASTDRYLAERARGFAQRMSGPREQRGPFRGFPGPDRRGFPPGPRGFPPGPRPEGPGAAPEPPPRATLPQELPPQADGLYRVRTPGGIPEAERSGYFRRPRVLNLEGGPYSPFDPADRPWDPHTHILSTAGKEYYSTIIVDDELVRVFSIPIWDGDRVEAVLQLAHPLDEMQRLNRNLVRTLLTLIPLALLVAGIGGMFLTERALRPVREITQAAAQIHAEDLSRRLVVRGQDEFTELAGTFNAMIARLESAFQRLERAYEQQRRFTGDASHELRTPLTTIKANTSLALAAERTPEEYREALQAADEAADLMNRTVQDLLLLARSDGGDLSLRMDVVPLEALYQHAAQVAKGRDSARLVIELPEHPLAVLGDRHHLSRLLTNLVENAVRHTPPEGRITLAGREQDREIRIDVSDTGEGIPAEHLPHVCERFYRVDSARSRAAGGTGLGLSICQSIVRAHGGEMRIESEEGCGTTVTLTLPRAEPPDGGRDESVSGSAVAAA